MSENKTSLFSTIKSFNKTFWLASFMELMERWAWYGIFTLFGLYLVGSTDEGGLGFNHIQKGNIMANVTAILYFLPIFFGVIADRIGYTHIAGQKKYRIDIVQEIENRLFKLFPYWYKEVKSALEKEGIA